MHSIQRNCRSRDETDRAEHRGRAVSAPAARRRGRPPGETEQGSATRARILEAAIDLFAAKGFHGTAIADIAERVGIQRGALYYHVSSKEDLLWQIVRTYLDAELTGLAAAQEADLEPEQRFRTMVRHHVRNIVDHQRAVAVNVRDGSALTGERAAHRQELRDRVELGWKALVEDGQRDGVFTTADPVVVNGILGMLNTVYLWYRPGSGDSPEQIAEKFSDTLLCGILGRC
jgi:AcrR family transcriptional regulator